MIAADTLGIELLEEETLYLGFNHLRRVVFRFPRYDGTLMACLSG